MSINLCPTVDHERGHICDWCGDGIAPGEGYYIAVEDELIFCSICGVQHEV